MVFLPCGLSPSHISDLEAETTGDKRVTMGEKIEAIRTTCFIDMFKYIIDVFNLSLPIEKMIDTLRGNLDTKNLRVASAIQLLGSLLTFLIAFLWIVS